MAVTVYASAARSAARHVQVRRKVRSVRDGVSRRARINLTEANATSRITFKGYFPASIDETEKIINDHEHAYTILHAPNAVALEFGHMPSGFFEGTETKPPDGEYILTKAAGI